MRNHRAGRRSGKNRGRVCGNRRAAVRMQRAEYSPLEMKRVLAALFPTWVNGTFTLGDPVAATPYQLADTFSLSTRPAAEKTIYLDFNGHHSVNNDWDHDIRFEPYDRDGDPSTFTDAELIEIQKIFQNVAEDFAPFDVNVTTVDPGLDALTRVGGSDTTWGIRVVHTQATPEFGGFGGVAFLNSFNDSIDNPCFAINKGVVNGAMTISHEVGHTLGLRHDGLNSASYHPGTGSGPTGWGPLMGAPFGKNLVHWSKGEYAGSTTTEDDLALITQAQHGVNYLPDDVGDSMATARSLALTSETTAFDWAIVGRPTDVDFFSFRVGAGPFSMDIRPFRENPNLDVLATLWDANGSIVATSNPVDDVVAGFSIPDIAAGNYFVSIDGVGKAGVYTDYGSLGFYTIEATFVSSVIPPIDIGEAGVVTGVNHLWKTVTLNRSWNNPVVVAGPATRIGGDPLTIRVRNVTGNSFQIRVDEWDYLDGRHSGEEISYLVMEAGTYTLPDGTVIQAGLDATNHRWDRAQFHEQFATIPNVFTQTMTENDPSAVVTRQRSITTIGFEYRVQEEQAADRFHAVETVGWIAVSLGQGVTEGNDFESLATPNEVTHLDYALDFVTDFSSRPVFLASMQSYYGGDPATIRLRSINASSATFFLEEERSFDSEIEHNSEVVGYFALEAGALQIPSEEEGRIFALRGPGDGSGSLFTDVSTDDSVLEAALRTMEGWGDTWSDLGRHSDNAGDGCCCGECLNSAWASIQTDSGLAGALLQGSGHGRNAESVSASAAPLVRVAIPQPEAGLQLAGFENRGAVSLTAVVAEFTSSDAETDSASVFELDPDLKSGV